MLPPSQHQSPGTTSLLFLPTGMTSCQNILPLHQHPQLNEEKGHHLLSVLEAHFTDEKAEAP